jgi:RNA-directed DNA polymerase
MYDRAMQALYAMALIPWAESTADKTSFGFRMKRNAQDAAAYIFQCLSRGNSAQWILEGDILGCFDNFAHHWMLDNIPLDTSILNQFLKPDLFMMEYSIAMNQVRPKAVSFRLYWQT